MSDKKCLEDRVALLERRLERLVDLLIPSSWDGSGHDFYEGIRHYKVGGTCVTDGCAACKIQDMMREET